MEVEASKPVRKIARQCRTAGQIEASKNKAWLYRQMLQLYRLAPRTDAELADLLDVERTTINGRRNELTDIVEIDKVKNPKTHQPNTRWGFEWQKKS